ncbi:MAG TPA: aldehyde dehydrogenase family protein [Polyangia bacterium]|jgi:acyl-CoA reductase-like NAD-dependent aldehyde dehydrogenase|nr:aldehyde dehydrogenase family protein [Polyangia bacterium]
MDEARIQAMVDEIVARVTAQVGHVPETPLEAVRNPPPGFAPAPSASSGHAPSSERERARRRDVDIPRGRRGVFPDVDAAVRAAQRAFAQNEAAPLESRRRWVQAMRDVARKHVSDLARFAVEETGYGRVDDKLKKNLLCIDKTPGPEFLRPTAFSGDDGLTLVERAPYGVIGSITPTTNPTETVINNGIGMVSGGNAVVYNVHPYAARTSGWFIHLLNEAVTGAGGPENLLSCVERPTIESAQELMRHPGVRLLVVTGGPAVVKAAMGSGKKVIAAGPGNPPAVVDATADLENAAKNIVLGASIDNNIICTAEKEVVAVASIADALKERLLAHGAVFVNDKQLRELEKVVLHDGAGGVHANKDFIGKDAGVIARQIGIRADDDLRLVMAEVDEKHPFVQLEMLMPVLPLVRVADAAAAIATAKRVEHGFGHTAVMYSRDIAHLHAMARTINTSIFVKNASNLAGLGLGGEGYTSFTIASPTGEGLTTVMSFTRERRCTLKEYFRIV